MNNPVFQASAPRGKMLLYASKITREIFTNFREKIKSLDERNRLTSYQEGPYDRNEHFIWAVEEPLAHSILLNLTLLGINQTDSVPVTDSPASHYAFLCKTSGVNKLYDLQIVAKKLMNLVLPPPENLDIRRILDFRDDHRQEMLRFWQALSTEQKKEADQIENGSSQLYIEARIEFENLKNSIKSAKTTLQWGIGGCLFQFVLGFASLNPLMLISGIATGSLLGIRYLKERYKKVSGYSYLLSIEEHL